MYVADMATDNSFQMSSIERCWLFNINFDVVNSLRCRTDYCLFIYRSITVEMQLFLLFLFVSDQKNLFLLFDTDSYFCKKIFVNKIKKLTVSNLIESCLALK